MLKEATERKIKNWKKDMEMCAVIQIERKRHEVSVETVPVYLKTKY